MYNSVNIPIIYIDNFHFLKELVGSFSKLTGSTSYGNTEK